MNFSALYRLLILALLSMVLPSDLLAIEKPFKTKDSTSLTLKADSMHSCDEGLLTATVMADDTLVFDDLEAPKTRDTSAIGQGNSEKARKLKKLPVESNGNSNISAACEVESVADIEVLVYPMPALAAERMELLTNISGQQQIIIRTLQGNVIEHLVTNSEKTGFSIASSGEYLITVIQGGKAKTLRIYVQ